MLISRNPSDFKKERASGVVKSHSFPSNAKCLAREASNKQFVVRDFASINCSDVFGIRGMAEVLGVNRGSVFVPFICVDAGMSEAGEG